MSLVHAVISFMHLKSVKPLLALFALNHVRVIAFRESTYAVNINQCMFLPTFLSRLLCRGKSGDFRLT